MQLDWSTLRTRASDSIVDEKRSNSGKNADFSQSGGCGHRQQSLTGWQSAGRYLAHFVVYVPFFLGVIWVGFDRRKQGWHDKLAGTVVIRSYQLESVETKIQKIK